MIIIDFETRSEVNLKTHGVRRYATHESTDVLMLAWMDTTAPDVVHQWFPGDAMPPWVDGTDSVYAFNIDFERDIWAYVLARRHGWPEIEPDRWQDVQALCARYAYPRKLDSVCTVMGLGEDAAKSRDGANLIRLFSVPPFAGRRPSPEWERYCAYNRQDVRATWEVLQRLPATTLSESEQAIWRLNTAINLRGIPVATDEAATIYRVVQEHLTAINARLPKLTGGQVTRITQVLRIVTWLQSRGVRVDDLRADTVTHLLDTLDADNPDNQDILEVLELRAASGLSSVGKYKRIIDMAHDDHMYHNSNYYGAHTGRITGSGFQLLNLPRATVDDPEAEIQSFVDGTISEHKSVRSARALVRSMIKAYDGWRLLCADYSSIEYVLLIWLAGETVAVRHFDEGRDPYRRLASSMYAVDYDAVTSQQRQMGKIGVLGCGYGLGVGGCVRYAAQWGLSLSLDEATRVVMSYRDQYPGVPRLWYALAEAAMSAVSSPGRAYTTHRTTFKAVESKGYRYLQMRLPSGRAMYYHRPEIVDGKYGPVVAVRGQNQMTRQWELKEMSPGKWTENVIQALGRDLLYYGKFALDRAGYNLIGSIYDEVIAHMPEGQGTLTEFNALMTSLPDWAKGLPLKATGWEGKRYRKD